MIVIVTGCSSACAKLDDNVSEVPIRYITSPEDAERWMAEIKVIENHNKGVGVEKLA